MVLRVLRDRFVRLAKDEDGAALVVTLAVFFFIYLICMGVYAVGTNVRERIHLQNACDAAAYSAAVVQADTLSRIATINRAMSWTYVQLTRRQMDYVVYKWLEKAEEKYRQSMREAKGRGSYGQHPSHGYWYIGVDDPGVTKYTVAKTDIAPDKDMVQLNESHKETWRVIENENKSFVNTRLSGDSFYSDQLANKTGINRLKVQIETDKSVIEAMNEKEDELVSDLRGHVEDAVSEILKANLNEYDEASGAMYFVDVADARDYFQIADSTDEGRFLKWVWFGLVA